MDPSRPNLSNTVRALCAGGFVALIVIVIAEPASSDALVRACELVAILVLGIVVLASVAALVLTRLGGWRESEPEFELTVRRSERLARDGLAAEPSEAEFLELDAFDDADFEELVQESLDDLPDLLQNALRQIRVTISPRGGRSGRYCAYEQGGGSAGTGRIVIYRGALRRDLGGDPQALQEELTNALRHELAHQVAFDSLGLSEPGV